MILQLLQGTNAAGQNEIRVTLSKFRVAQPAVLGGGFHPFQIGRPPYLHVSDELWDSFAAKLAMLVAEKKKTRTAVFCYIVPTLLAVVGMLGCMRILCTDHGDECEIPLWFYILWSHLYMFILAAAFWFEQTPKREWQAAVQSLVDKVAPEFYEEGYHTEFVADRTGCCRLLLGVREYIRFTPSYRSRVVSAAKQNALVESYYQPMTA